jgi:HK97 family phage major capsid protein
MSEKLDAMRQKLGTLKDDLRKILTVAEEDKRLSLNEDEEKRYAELEAEYKGLKANVARWEADEAEERYLSESPTPPIRPDPADNGDSKKVTPMIKVGKDLEATRHFRNLGEQMKAIMDAGTPDRSVDKRLLAVNEEVRAASGMSEGVDSEGGYALQLDFAGMIFESAVETGDILKLVDKYPVGAGADGAKWVDVEETSIATTVMGGIQVYWRDEAATVTKSMPKLKSRELRLKTLMGIAYGTDELLQDTTFASALYQKGFGLAIERHLEGDIIDGDGAGRPKGILEGGALISVAKEAGQAADTVMYENVVKMFHRTLPSSRKNLVWLVNPDVGQELDFMEYPIGTGGVPVYLPPGGASVGGFSTLRGRPVIVTDHCSAIGDKGDIILCDLSHYMLIQKGGVDAQQSMHVRFLYGEETFRFTFRANGQPKENSALTIKNSGNTRSAFVTLAAR